MNSDKARRRLDRHLKTNRQAPVTDAEWALALRRHEQDVAFAPGSAEEAEGDLAELAYGPVMFHRQLSGIVGAGSQESWRSVSAGDVTPPEWWIEESRRRLARYCDDKVTTRARLGLFRKSAPMGAPLADATVAVPLAELGPFLRRQAEQQPSGGHRARLRYLFSWEGLDHTPSGAEMVVRARAGEPAFGINSVEVYCGPEPGVPVGELPPLALLSRYTEALGAALGVDPGEVTAWLLCDREIVLPWIDVQLSLRAQAHGAPSIDADNIMVTMVVGTVQVPARTVAEVYAEMRRRILGERSVKQPSVWPLRVRGFMTDWRSGRTSVDWGAAYAAFMEQYPDAPYGKMRTFRAAGYAKPRGGQKP